MKTEIIFLAIIFTLRTSHASFYNDHYVGAPTEKTLTSFIGNKYVDDPLEKSLTRNVSNREERVLAFLRIRIPAALCDTGLEVTDEGYCDGVVSCLSYTGRITGICRDGIGVCCLVRRGCHRTLASRISYFTNDGFSIFSINKSPCVATVKRYKKEVTQLRLDFIDLELQQPTAAGVCQTERLIVTGHLGTFNVPILCGILTGSHIYVPYNAAGADITINITLNDASTPFTIKVTQITKDEDIAAPAGCLQYYYTETGEVESFNYDGDILLGISYRFCLPSTLESVIWMEETFEIDDPTGSGSCTTDFLTFYDAIDLDLPSGESVAALDVCYVFPTAGIESWSNIVMVTHNKKGLGADLSFRRRFRLTYDAVF